MADDYKEEQATEVDALLSIYGEELQVLSDEPYILQIKINGTVEESDQNENETSVSAELQFTLEGDYPNSIPQITILETENIEGGDVEDLQNALLEESQNNIGMVMIFTLVSTAQEFINALFDKLKDQKLKEQEAKRRKEQEEHEKKFHGTPVTVESFTAWRIQFERDFLCLQRNADESSWGASKRLTGRQLFEQDSSLNVSDVQFIAEGGVEVDESLFQDFGDLELEEELA